MQHVESSVVVGASPEDVYDYVRSPGHQTDWMLSLKEIFDVQGEGAGTSWRWKYRMMGVPLEGNSRVVEEQPGQRLLVSTEGGVKSTWEWRLQPEGDRTRLTLMIDYEVPVPVLGRLAEKLVVRRNQRETQANLTNVKEILEG